MPANSPCFDPQLCRVLVRGVNWLGDAVMTTPALQRLREALPDSHIALLTNEKLADLWRYDPCLNSVITFAAGESLWSVARRLSAERFQTALVLPNSPRSALEAWLAGIPQRIGNKGHWRRWFLTRMAAPRPDSMHMHKRSIREVHRRIDASANGIHNEGRRFFPATAHQTHEYLHLAAVLGANPEPIPSRLVVKTEEVQAVAAKFNLAAEITDRRPFFGLNPGATYGPAKRWPAERFAAVAREVQRRTQCVCLIFGGAAEVALSREVQAATGIRQPALFNLAGQTTLRELCALLKLCRVLLTNDTGPMHIAAALGTPVVVPFGSTSSELTGPGLSGDTRHQLLKSTAPCAPCFRRTCPVDFRCMTGIAVETVVEAVSRVIQPSALSSACVSRPVTG